jgi:hypothetical protein
MSGRSLEVLPVIGGRPKRLSRFKREGRGKIDDLPSQREIVSHVLALACFPNPMMCTIRRAMRSAYTDSIRQDPRPSSPSVHPIVSSEAKHAHVPNSFGNKLSFRLRKTPHVAKCLAKRVSIARPHQRLAARTKPRSNRGDGFVTSITLVHRRLRRG